MGNPIIFETRDEVLEAADRAELEGIHVYYLSTRSVYSKKGLFDAVRATLPLDPPLESERSWDALDDSLFGGFALDPRHAVIAWPDADDFARADPETYATALEILVDVCRKLSSPGYGLPTPVFVDLMISSRTPPPPFHRGVIARDGLASSEVFSSPTAPRRERQLPDGVFDEP